METMFAHGLQQLSDATELFLVFIVVMVVAVLVLRSPPQQLLVLSVLVLLAGLVLVTLAGHAATQPEPPFNPDFRVAVIALAGAPCIVGGAGLLLWVRRRDH